MQFWYPRVKLNRITLPLTRYHTVTTGHGQKSVVLEQVPWKLNSILRPSLISLLPTMTTVPNHFTHTRRMHRYIQVFARKNDDGSFFGNKVKVLAKNKFDSISSISPSSTYPLPRTKFFFLEEVIQDAYSEVYEETGEEKLITNSVLIEDVAIQEEGNHSLLRGSSSSHRSKLWISDHDMWAYPDGSIIPGCEFDICFYKERTTAPGASRMMIIGIHQHQPVLLSQHLPVILATIRITMGVGVMTMTVPLTGRNM